MHTSDEWGRVENKGLETYIRNTNRNFLTEGQLVP